MRCKEFGGYKQRKFFTTEDTEVTEGLIFHHGERRVLQSI